jgi:hypothetical protein
MGFPSKHVACHSVNVAASIPLIVLHGSVLPIPGISCQTEGGEASKMVQKKGATMTEREWQTCADPKPMLKFLRGKGSDRKLRLFAVACHERIWHFLNDKEDCRKTIQFAERFADGLATRNELHGRAWGKPGSVFSVVLYKAWDAAKNSLEFGAGAAKEAVLRMDPEKYKEREDALNAAWENHRLGEAMQIADAAMPTEWMAKGISAWTEERSGQCELLREILGSLSFRSLNLDPSSLAPNVKVVAQAIYDDRAFERMPELADALEEAGCDNEEILSHCRGLGPHVRGCWVVDLVLGKA